MPNLKNIKYNYFYYDHSKDLLQNMHLYLVFWVLLSPRFVRGFRTKQSRNKKK